ncbi:ribose-phosphate pyrophosphokinase [Candidatus Beckwithbacteria bacterium]|nr:ribose-phosphate pyrophosphokinase [Candidatus Beckwithbacteria bacterium]
MQVFSGSSNLPLAHKIAQNLDCKLAKVEINKFPNQEIRLWINEEKIDHKAVVVQSFAKEPDRMIIEFCLLVDALKRLGVKEITAVIPWMGYCIQDKIFRNGEPLSSRVIADIIQATKVNEIITVDLHNETTQGFFSLPLIHLSATNLFVEKLKNNNLDCLVAPDVGALKETIPIAKAMNLPIVIISKKRDLQTGKVQILGIEGDIEGKNALIVDDFISTGGTLIQAAEFLKKQKAKTITVAATHHLFVEGVEARLEKSLIDKLYITDTINSEDEKVDHQFLDIISISETITKKID